MEIIEGHRAAALQAMADILMMRMGSRRMIIMAGPVRADAGRDGSGQARSCASTVRPASSTSAAGPDVYLSAANGRMQDFLLHRPRDDVALLTWTFMLLPPTALGSIVPARRLYSSYTSMATCPTSTCLAGLKW
ncbi:hypothetical protein GOP47_0002055 [Adiantum capillus-veneris]|uniref:Uncharacterized protein n=1 Tax=Adiantum capillus-veneris TaxID=13818 RepID=A0A9D4ZQU7_ADICA|nr:hypothetical protein GOP47_0002055 [Adiantum capillus-veneris]